MRYPGKFIIATLILLLTRYAPSLAQAKDSLATADSGSRQGKDHFIIGTTYNSDINYYGRVAGTKNSGIYPFVGLSFRNGLYANATFVFIRNSQQTKYAATLVEGGYNFSNKKGSWAGSLSASKYFYQDSTNLVQSAVKEVFSASISNLNKIINITLGGNVKLSDQADIGAQAGLDHIVRIPNIFGGDVIVLDPSAYVYAGTQNFTRTYYTQKNLLIFPGPTQQVTTNSREFNVLAYEFSLPVIYGYKKLNLIFSPAYIMPQHILTVPDQPALSETGANLFYFTATIKLTL